jgi:chromosome segregation protein
MPARLKSLELQGYKTFAVRTVFEFADSITAIVGPNGSGKSNIADALRWVLGEQSYSLLRGKKTEDMIFAGSEQRSRAGMASATILFDNSDDWLPIDYSEVAVARRAYRDGQNEYLLNNQRVRLRDVSELLSESGLAERTYTIIGQGLVDAALALKAEERRRLFEEAAGIGLHRSRREEALRRLDATQRNLERVQDILTELQPRLRSLERQARRAEEYEQVKADLRQVLREWYGYHWHRAQRELSEARRKARRQEIALDSARQAQANYHQKLRSARNRIQELREQSNIQHRKSAELHNQREEVNRKLAVLDERQTSLARLRTNLQNDILRLEERIGVEQNRFEQAAREVARLEEELKEAQNQAGQASAVLNSRQAEREAAEVALREARVSLTELNDQRSQIGVRLSERQAQMERLSVVLLESKNTLEESSRRAREFEERFASSTEAMKVAENAWNEVEARLKIQQKRIGDLEKKQAEVAEAQAGTLADLARIRAQLDVIEQAEQALDGYASGARILLQAARQKELKGALGALSSNLDVPPELETAVAAVLGDFLDAILLNGEANPEAALELLERRSARAALLPLDSIIPSPPLTLNGDLESRKILGVAADLVHASSDLQPVLDALLGQVLVVKDRHAARQVLDDLYSKGGSGSEVQTIKAVTLRGEVFHGSGLILAGSESKSTTLSRPRQRRELEQQMALSTRRMDHFRIQQEELDRQLSDLTSEHDELRKSLEAKNRELDEARKAYRQESVALEQAQREAKWQEEKYMGLGREIDSTKQEIAQMEARAGQLEAKLAEGDEYLKEKAAQLAALSIDEYRARVSHWNTRCAVIERALTDAKVRQTERKIGLEEARSTQSVYRDRLEEIGLDEESQKVEKIELRHSELGISKQIEEIGGLIDLTEGALATVENEQEKLLTSEGDAQQESNVIEHQYAQSRIELARRQEGLESLKRRIEDDFGLVAFEYAEDVSGPTPLPIQGMVERLPLVTELSAETEESLKRQRAQLRRMGPINPEAREEYKEVKERYLFLTNQVNDLNKAEADIHKVISELDTLMEREFHSTFQAVEGEFRQIFHRLFGGGSARLVLTDPEDLTNTGIDIEARLPGRREQGLSLLSGGERSLTAAALVFALLRVSPTPFCVLDEVDAMLDEANVGRFRELLRELSQSTQFIIITHNRNTVQVADIIYGVTMGRDSTSQVISLKLDEVSKVIA